MWETNKDLTTHNKPEPHNKPKIQVLPTIKEDIRVIKTIKDPGEPLTTITTNIHNPTSINNQTLNINNHSIININHHHKIIPNNLTIPKALKRF